MKKLTLASSLLCVLALGDLAHASNGVSADGGDRVGNGGQVTDPQIDRILGFVSSGAPKLALALEKASKSVQFEMIKPMIDLSEETESYSIRAADRVFINAAAYQKMSPQAQAALKIEMVVLARGLVEWNDQIPAEALALQTLQRQPDLSPKQVENIVKLRMDLMKLNPGSIKAFFAKRFAVGLVHLSSSPVTATPGLLAQLQKENGIKTPE